jgi:hypothetical protein
MTFVVLAAVKCKEKPPKEDDPEPNQLELSGNLTTQTLDASKKYLLKGQVFVQDGVTLTIPAGTVLMGDKATKATLIVKPGGKINAQGTSSNPIVFTSALPAGARDKGDWGGVILLGNAQVNQISPSIEGITPVVTYGGSDNADSSGVMKYVRIEYAGIALSPNNETNSLTLGGVGSKTVLEYIQVSYGGDDGFEWFGGTVNAKHLVSFATWDDDFDCDFGFSGKVQFGLALRDPFSADQSGSNGFEVDNDATGSAATPQTSAVFSNMTIMGPKTDSSTSISGNYNQALHLRRNSAISIFNSIFAGWTKGLLIDGNSTYGNYTGGTGVLDRNILAFTKNGANQPSWYASASGNTHTASDVQTYWLTTKANKADTIYTNPSKVTDWSAVGLKEANFYSENTSYPSNPDLTSVTPTGSLMPAASFADAKLSGSFFTTTAYVGAFSTAADWTDGWSEFNPNSRIY